mmetsp:Transcript_22439/g.67347  ORF Transcript_22439/g.67347 Transcript_22439/m.67347 type:complete len:243 (-) Transcript_22439:445-1173(-)
MAIMRRRTSKTRQPLLIRPVATDPETLDPSAMVTKGRAASDADLDSSRPRSRAKYVGSQACMKKKLQLMQLCTCVRAAIWPATAHLPMVDAPPLAFLATACAGFSAVEVTFWLTARPPAAHAAPMAPTATDSAFQPMELTREPASRPTADPALKQKKMLAMPPDLAAGGSHCDTTARDPGSAGPEARPKSTRRATRAGTGLAAAAASGMAMMQQDQTRRPPSITGAPPTLSASAPPAPFVSA